MGIIPEKRLGSLWLIYWYRRKWEGGRGTPKGGKGVICCFHLKGRKGKKGIQRIQACSKTTFADGKNTGNVGNQILTWSRFAWWTMLEWWSPALSCPVSMYWKRRPFEDKTRQGIIYDEDFPTRSNPLMFLLLFSFFWFTLSSVPPEFRYQRIAQILIEDNFSWARAYW